MELIKKQYHLKLINKWILNEFLKLKTEYFSLLKETCLNISSITNILIYFVEKKISKQYLELLKFLTKQNCSKELEKDLTKKREYDVFLFVCQQLLIMFHPIIPDLTIYLYNLLTGEKILDDKVFLESFEINDNNKELWQIDLILSLWKLEENSNSKEEDIFFLELDSFYLEKKNPFFDLDIFFLNKKQIFSLKEEEKKSFSSFNVFPFGTIWKKNKKNNEKKEDIEFEYKRCFDLLSNENFIRKAPKELIEKEKQKLEYYKKKILVKKH